MDLISAFMCNKVVFEYDKEKDSKMYYIIYFNIIIIEIPLFIHLKSYQVWVVGCCWWNPKTIFKCSDIHSKVFSY